MYSVIIISLNADFVNKLSINKGLTIKMNYRDHLFSHAPLSAAFTGYRPSKLPFALTDENIEKLKGKIKEAVTTLYKRGFTCFYSGMCTGVDIWAAEVVLELKESFPDISLICAIPFEGHSDALGIAELEKYKRITSEADRVSVLKGRIDFRGAGRAFNARNKYMVDNADALIAVCNKDNMISGGTANTVKMAEKKNIEIIFIDPSDI